MSLFDQVMDQVFRAVRADRLPVAYQFSAARMIEERNAPAVAEWLADATEERIREALEHIVWTGSRCEDGAVIQATQAMERDRAVATCIKCTCDDLHGCAEGCSWLRLDRKTGLGLCGAWWCHRLADWDAGDRTLGMEAERSFAIPVPPGVWSELVRPNHHLSIFVAGLWQISKQIMRSMLILLVMTLVYLLFVFGIVGLMEGFWLFSAPHGPYWMVWGSRVSGIVWVCLFFYLLYRHIMRLGQERIRISHEKDP